MFPWLEKHRQWLLPTVLILFILEIMTLPFVIGLTYSGRSESPNHTLVYSADSESASLMWDSATGIRADGTAELDVFQAEYDGVKAEDGQNVVAPGTEGFNIVRLENSVKGSIRYTAVFYRIQTNDKLPVKASLSGTGFTDTDTYSLPAGVEEKQVLRAVTGQLGGGQRQDFDINWLWTFYESDDQDMVDTYLGNKDPADRVTVGLYIVVEDDNSYITPDVPKTGDDSFLGLHLSLLCLSAFVLILLFVSRKWEEKCKK